MIEGLWRRGLLALLLAGLLVVGLALWLERAGEGPAASGRSAVDGAAAGVREFLLPAAVPRGEAWLLYIAAPGEVLPARVAPVAEIGAGGAVRLVRPAPVPAGPEAEPWWAAGIVLPGDRLGGLDPLGRAALLALMRAWRGTIGLGSPWRALTFGIADPEELQVLSRWER
jgi:hypothetical protein